MAASSASEISSPKDARCTKLSNSVSACRLDLQLVPDALDPASTLGNMCGLVRNFVRCDLAAQSYAARYGCNVDVAALSEIVVVQGRLHLGGDRGVLSRRRSSVESVHRGVADARTSVLGFFAGLVKRLAGRLCQRRPG